MARLLPPALIFFANAMMHIALLLRLPEIAASAGMDKAQLGLAMLGGAAGTFLALPFAGRVVSAIGPRRTTVLMLSILAVFLPLMTIANAWGIAAGFVVNSFLRTILEVGQNMVASRIETETGTKVMARSHGFWSVGLLAGTLLAAGIMALGIAPFFHQAIIGVIVLAVGAAVLRILPPDSIAAREPEIRRPLFILPDWPVILICAMTFGVSLMEGTIYDWGMFFLKDVTEATPVAAGLIMAAFTIGMGGTRLVGDALRERFPPSLLVRCSIGSILLGLCFLLLAPGWIAAGLGMALIGAGVALNAPLGFSTAAALPGRAPADNLAALSFAGMMAGLGVPPTLGFVAEHMGLVACFAVTVPFLLLSLYMAPVAEGRRPWRRPIAAVP